MNPVAGTAALDDGRLVELLPSQAVDVPLYWQCWRLDVLRWVLTAAVQRQAALSLATDGLSPQGAPDKAPAAQPLDGNAAG